MNKKLGLTKILLLSSILAAPLIAGSITFVTACGGNSTPIPPPQDTTKYLNLASAAPGTYYVGTESSSIDVLTNADWSDVQLSIVSYTPKDGSASQTVVDQNKINKVAKLTKTENKTVQIQRGVGDENVWTGPVVLGIKASLISKPEINVTSYYNYVNFKAGFSTLTNNIVTSLANMGTSSPTIYGNAFSLSPGTYADQTYFQTMADTFGASSTDYFSTDGNQFISSSNLAFAFVQDTEPLQIKCSFKPSIPYLDSANYRIYTIQSGDINISVLPCKSGDSIGVFETTAYNVAPDVQYIKDRVLTTFQLGADITANKLKIDSVRVAVLNENKYFFNLQVEGYIGTVQLLLYTKIHVTHAIFGTTTDLGYFSWDTTEFPDGNNLISKVVQINNTDNNNSVFVTYNGKYYFKHIAADYFPNNNPYVDDNTVEKTLYVAANANNSSNYYTSTIQVKNQGELPNNLKDILVSDIGDGITINYSKTENLLQTYATPDKQIAWAGTVIRTTDNSTKPSAADIEAVISTNNSGILAVTNVTNITLENEISWVTKFDLQIPETQDNSRPSYSKRQHYYFGQENTWNLPSLSVKIQTHLKGIIASTATELGGINFTSVKPTISAVWGAIVAKQKSTYDSNSTNKTNLKKFLELLNDGNTQTIDNSIVNEANGTVSIYGTSGKTGEPIVEFSISNITATSAQISFVAPTPNESQVNSIYDNDKVTVSFQKGYSIDSVLFIQTDADPSKSTPFAVNNPEYFPSSMFVDTPNTQNSSAYATASANGTFLYGGNSSVPGIMARLQTNFGSNIANAADFTIKTGVAFVKWTSDDPFNAQFADNWTQAQQPNGNLYKLLVFPRDQTSSTVTGYQYLYIAKSMDIGEKLGYTEPSSSNADTYSSGQKGIVSFGIGLSQYPSAESFTGNPTETDETKLGVPAITDYSAAKGSPIAGNFWKLQTTTTPSTETIELAKLNGKVFWWAAAVSYVYGCYTFAQGGVASLQSAADWIASGGADTNVKPADLTWEGFVAEILKSDSDIKTKAYENYLLFGNRLVNTKAETQVLSQKTVVSAGQTTNALYYGEITVNFVGSPIPVQAIFGKPEGTTSYIDIGAAITSDNIAQDIGTKIFAMYKDDFQKIGILDTGTFDANFTDPDTSHLAHYFVFSAQMGTNTYPLSLRQIDGEISKYYLTPNTHINIIATYGTNICEFFSNSSSTNGNQNPDILNYSSIKNLDANSFLYDADKNVLYQDEGVFLYDLVLNQTPHNPSFKAQWVDVQKSDILIRDVTTDTDGNVKFAVYPSSTKFDSDGTPTTPDPMVITHFSAYGSSTSTGGKDVVWFKLNKTNTHILCTDLNMDGVNMVNLKINQNSQKIGYTISIYDSGTSYIINNYDFQWFIDAPTIVEVKLLFQSLCKTVAKWWAAPTDSNGTSITDPNSKNLDADAMFNSIVWSDFNINYSHNYLMNSGKITMTLNSDALYYKQINNQTGIDNKLFEINYDLLPW